MTKKRIALAGGVISLMLCVGGWFIYAQLSASESRKEDNRMTETASVKNPEIPEKQIERKELPPAGPAGTPDGIYRPLAPEDIPYLEKINQESKNQ